MGLVEQTTAKGNLAEREIGPQHDVLSQFDAPTPEKSTGTNAERLLERATEVAVAHTRESRELSNGNSSGEMRIDMGHQSHRSPRCQSPSNPRSSVSGPTHAASCLGGRLNRGLPALLPGGQVYHGISPQCDTLSAVALGASGPPKASRSNRHET